MNTTRWKDFEDEEYDTERERQKGQFEEVKQIFAGLPSGMPFEDACRIKAAQGHKPAQDWIRRFDSYEWRRDYALRHAAVEKHPGWRSAGNGTYVEAGRRRSGV